MDKSKYKVCPFETNKIKTVMLTITQKCNLACVYCYEHDKNGKDMTVEQAINIIKYEDELNDGHNALSIDFFGGEPLMNFNLIKEVVEYFKIYYFKTPCRFFFTTNGTLVHGEVKDWLIRNRKYISCGLSLDGNKYVHDKNRSNSYDMIELDFFLKEYPKQGIKMTLHPNTIDHFAESVKTLHEMGFEVSCNLAYGADWSSDIVFAEFQKQLEELVRYYIKNPKLKTCTMLRADFPIVQKSKTVRKWCGMKTNIRCYDLDGKCYPCQHFMPVSTNGHKPIISEDMNVNFDIPKCNLPEECMKCKLIDFCPTCYGANYAATGNMFQKDMNQCRYLKFQFWAKAYLAGYKLAHNLHDGTNKEKVNIAKSVLYVQNELDSIFG